MPCTHAGYSTGPGNSLGFDGKPETQKALSCLPVFTLMGTTPKLAGGGISSHLPRSGTLSGSIPALINQEAQAIDHSISGEEDLIYLNHPALDTWGFPTSVDFPSQVPGSDILTLRDIYQESGRDLLFLPTDNYLGRAGHRVLGHLW